MEFNHINDCWNYLREAKDYDDLYNRTLELPRWSGDWDITRNEYNECLVINTVWNEQYQNFEEEIEDFDIPWPIEQEEEDR